MPPRLRRIGLDVGGARLEPGRHLEFAVRAERAGFDDVWIGDHFLPWFHTAAQAPHPYPWLGAAAALTRRVHLGIDVTVPIGGRYHPALVAQAFATLDNMFPGRFLVGVGTGEAMNEARFLGYWPRWRERVERLVEGIALMRRLWSEEDYFDFQGRYFTLEKVYLYTRPKGRLPIYFSALGPKAAYYAGRYGDHAMLLATPDDIRDRLLPSFQRGLKDAGRRLEGCDVVAALGLGIGDREAIKQIIRSSFAGASIREMFNELDPRVIEARGRELSDEWIEERFRIFDNPDGAIGLLEEYLRAGANGLIVGDLAFQYEGLIEVFATHIIPYLRENYGE
jgi:G6PDH family F420-dependent oxidoreductase